MGTAERQEAPGYGATAQLTARRGPGTRDRDISAAATREAAGSRDVPVGTGDGAALYSALFEATTITGERGTAVPASVSRAAEHRADADVHSTAEAGEHGTDHERPYYRPLWVEEPATRRRMPDPVRTAAVRAVLIISVTLIQAMVAFLCTMAGSWPAFPMVLSSVASTVVATWAALDVWVTRQVWNQRHGVVSTPSSTARVLRRERRRTRRQERTDERTQQRIRRRGGARQLSHS